jgi:hypothetical protein
MIRGGDSQSYRLQLERIVSSATFARSERMRRFLRFVVEESLQEDAAVSLKESVIPVHVFDRRANLRPGVGPGRARGSEAAAI